MAGWFYDHFMTARHGVQALCAAVLAAAVSVAALVAGRVRTPLAHDLWFIVSIIIAGVATVGLFAASAPDIPGWFRGLANAAPGVVITSPSPDQRVTHAFTARGSARRIPCDMTLWLVVQAGHSMYPQAKAYLPPGGTGTWAQLVHFGRPDASVVGHKYLLYAVGADRAANSQLEIYLQQQAAGQRPDPLSEAKGTWPQIPTYATVNVVRGL